MGNSALLQPLLDTNITFVISYSLWGLDTQYSLALNLLRIYLPTSFQDHYTSYQPQIRSYFPSAHIPKEH